MKQAIWKFETPIVDRFSLQMPIGSEILSIQQDEKTMVPCIWALVYPDNIKEERFFELIGTGHEIHNDMGIERKYIGTYQYKKGEFIGHLFERFS